MSTFFGRHKELAQLERAYARASESAPQLAFVSGANGLGKTALLDTFSGKTRTRKALVRVRSGRFDRLLPQATILETPPSVVVVDDAQWAAPELLAGIADGLQDGTIVFVLLAATCNIAIPRSPDVRINLQPLDDHTIEAIVSAHAAAPSEHLSASIVHWAGGSPYEAATLATLTESDVSAARAIARFVGSLPPAARRFAQFLALIGAPIDDTFARALMPEARELAAAREALTPLLAAGTATIAFNHVLTESAVVETVAMKIPLHRRIVAALERRGLHDVYDRAIMLEQFLGSTDRTRAQAAALELAFEAQQLQATGAQLWASQHHMELGEPPDERFVAFYTQYAQALLTAGEFERAEIVISHAFNAAQQRNLADSVSLGSKLIEAQWKSDRKEAAKATYERLSAAFSETSALAQLKLGAPWLQAC